jgi:hypothetical protein
MRGVVRCSIEPETVWYAVIPHGNLSREGALIRRADVRFRAYTDRHGDLSFLCEGHQPRHWIERVGFCRLSLRVQVV